MIQKIDQNFKMIKDTQASWHIEDVYISRCIFDNCLFSEHSIDVRRSIGENITAEHCKFIGCQVGPGKFVNCHLKNSTATDLVIFWGAIFENVVLSGRVPAIKINTKITLIPDEGVQANYDRDRVLHYKNIDTAIDISNARFTVFESKGIPAKLFKIDGDTQAVIRRECINDIKNIDSLEHNPWYPWIKSFLANQENDLILATPLSKPKAKRDQFLAGLVELRNKGIADPA